MKRTALLLLMSCLMVSCSDFQGCRELVSDYDFAIGMLPRSDTLQVNERYRVDYFGELKDVLAGEKVAEINPLFTIALRIYRIDTNALFPVLSSAVSAFDVEDLVPGTFSGKNNVRINLNILQADKIGFVGGVFLIPKIPGWYLIDLVPVEIYPVESGSDRSCEKVQQVSYRLINTNDPFGAHYDELQRASVFKPQTQRLIWVK